MQMLCHFSTHSLQIIFRIIRETFKTCKGLVVAGSQPFEVTVSADGGGGWSGGAMVLGKLPVPGRPIISITLGQGPTALAVGAGGGCLDIFTLIYPFSPFSPSLWETARYRLKYCLKGPLNPKQPTNQPISADGPHVRARSSYCRRHSKKNRLRELLVLNYLMFVTYACLYVLLCGPKIRNKDSCIYLTTNCMKERDMGGVRTMIGTSASRRGWSGRGYMRARFEGLVVGERKLQTNGAPY